MDALSARISAASAREGFRRDFARLLARHAPIFDDVDGVPPGTVRCNWITCGFGITVQPEESFDGDDYWWHARFAEHQAAVLSEALPL